MRYAHSGERIRMRADEWNAVADMANHKPPATTEIITRTKSKLAVTVINIGGEKIGQFEAVVLWRPDDVEIPEIPQLYKSDVIFPCSTPGAIATKELKAETTTTHVVIRSAFPPFEIVDEYDNVLTYKEEVYQYNIDDYYLVGIAQSEIEAGGVGQVVVAGFSKAWVKPTLYDLKYQFQDRVVNTPPFIYQTAVHMNRAFRPHYGLRNNTRYLMSYDEGEWHSWSTERLEARTWIYENQINYINAGVCPFEIVEYADKEIKEYPDDVQCRLAIVRFRDRFVRTENLQWEATV